MKKRAIVIASVLKPLDDTRMYEKMGRSLAETQQWQVHIIGYGESRSDEPNIIFHPLGKPKRISLARIYARLKVLGMLFRIKPAVIIINTHELFSISILYRFINRAKLIYDVQENYYLNILHTSAFPKGLRLLIASLVRFRERMASPFVHHFILAEKCYENELPFINNRFTIVENNCRLPVDFKRKTYQDETRLLFSGTLDESTGVLKAIDLAKQLHKKDSKISLRIIGYSARHSMRKIILATIKDCPFISIHGLDHLVSHTQIFDELAQADFGIIYYEPSIHTQNRIPTKVYEYLACQLPIIYDKNARWKSMVEKSKGGIEISFDQFNIEKIWSAMQAENLYTENVEIPKWENAEIDFLKVINS